MKTLSELVDQDYKEEVEIIRETGNVWWQGVAVGVVLIAIWLFDTFLFGRPWDMKDVDCALIAVFGLPYIARAWERHEVAAKMRHEREVRMEVKLDALLGLINLKKDE